jgi:hypothetical protein
MRTWRPEGLAATVGDIDIQACCEEGCAVTVYQCFHGLDHRVGHFRPFSMTAKHFPILFSLLARLSQDSNIFHQILTDDTNPML